MCESWPDRNRETSMGSVMVIMGERERYEERRKERRQKEVMLKGCNLSYSWLYRLYLQ